MSCIKNGDFKLNVSCDPYRYWALATAAQREGGVSFHFQVAHIEFGSLRIGNKL